LFEKKFSELKEKLSTQSQSDWSLVPEPVIRYAAALMNKTYRSYHSDFGTHGKKKAKTRKKGQTINPLGTRALKNREKPHKAKTDEVVVEEPATQHKHLH